ncbi:hypothetical protein ES703_36394 [subsurface metagenome]
MANSENIIELIRQKKLFDLKNLISGLLPFDITEIIEPLETGEKVIVLRLLNKETAAEVFSHLEHEDQEEMLVHFSMDRVKEIMEEMDPDDQEEVAGVLTKYDLTALPVVDKDKKLVGIITVDDIVDVIHKEATEDFHKMAGIEAPDEPYFSTRFLVLGRKRALWLVILLVMSYFSSIVLKHYSRILEIVIPLAFFIPMLTGTCGNTGMQSATLIIRGLATGEIKGKDIRKILFREIFMGGFLGIILGIFSFVRARFVDIDPFIGIAVGTAVFISVMTANIIGTILPLLLKKLKIDPAISAGPFISTIIDVTSLILYFEIAQVVFHIRIQT